MTRSFEELRLQGDSDGITELNPDATIGDAPRPRAAAARRPSFLY